MKNCSRDLKALKGVGSVRSGIDLSQRGLVGLRRNTVGTARIGEGLTSDRNELPIVAGRVQGQLQHPPGRAVPHLTIRRNSVKRGQACATCAYHKLTNATSRIRCPIWILQSKTLIIMHVSAQHHICPRGIE